ncbi:hypothetical protein [uncultured Clostridium sp.]|uniref:hypothetical protein n=1 Tax=uncultured Clostridium sp. TaxID=59620 RepID=UPI00260BCE64|nr:hypothetical protein [uncultured Clostridium sp.]
MAFKRIIGIGEGTYNVQIVKTILVSYPGNKQALKITVKTIEDDEVYHTFLIFINNTYVITKLINVTYEENFDEEIDEEDFNGVYMEITTKEKNGYINIIDINPVDGE